MIDEITSLMNQKEIQEIERWSNLKCCDLLFDSNLLKEKQANF